MKYFKVSTWNVNSIRVRLKRLMAFLERERPDICCLQEIKCEKSFFPYDELKNLNYHATVLGQKSYNGVAILSLVKPEKIIEPAIDNDSRIIGISVHGMTIYSVYAPNGQEVGSDKYVAKLEWFSKLSNFLTKNKENVLLCGDFNVAPEDIDVYDPVLFKDSILFTEPEKNAFRKIIELNFTDTFTLHHKGKGNYSWWDYRNMAFEKNNGLRLDFILASKPLSDKCVWSRIDRSERKGEKPSDHAPVISEFENL